MLTHDDQIRRPRERRGLERVLHEVLRVHGLVQNGVHRLAFAIHPRQGVQASGHMSDQLNLILGKQLIVAPVRWLEVAVVS
jgi:hypothetical protein